MPKHAYDHKFTKLSYKQILQNSKWILDIIVLSRREQQLLLFFVTFSHSKSISQIGKLKKKTKQKNN